MQHAGGWVGFNLGCQSATWRAEGAAGPFASEAPAPGIESLWRLTGVRAEPRPLERASDPAPVWEGGGEGGSVGPGDAYI